MLGWMLGRGENAPDAVGDGDTTQIDPPDTPAPVFAARAFKSALFGTPAPRSDRTQPFQGKTKGKPAVSTTERDSGTPLKPQGILLTPGTGTTRRKRVSFNHDLLASTKTITPDCSLAEKDGATTDNNKRTRLSEALEKAKGKGTGGGVSKTETRQAKDESDDEWEEDNGDDCCTNDITLDLNEPHSQSGKYWKSEFERYHREAMAEMEKLLKYKQLAKSYAHEKDVEAIQLAERLKEEQEKVIAMEKKAAVDPSQMASKQREGPFAESPELLATLTKQTALAAQYRYRVQEQEDQLEELRSGREEDSESKGRRRRQRAPSPSTQRTLLETQRELRRARTQLKELTALREQVASLTDQLKLASQREATDGVAADGPAETTRMQDLRAQLRQAKEESAKKDEEIRKLKSEFEAFKKESEAHDADANAVLERAHTKIFDLKKEIKGLKATGSTEQPRPRSWHRFGEDDQVTQDDVNVGIQPRRSTVSGAARRSLDLSDLDDVPDFLATKSRTLRDKYQEGAAPGADEAVETAPSKMVPSVLADRPNLEKPRWQPFVPRSPRNRAYLGEDLSNRIQNGGTAGASTKAKDVAADIAVPDLPALAKSIARTKRRGSVDRGDVEVDLLQDRFARLGGPDAGQDNIKTKSTVVVSATRSALPPERRAAALARIEKRMAEKRAQRRNGVDKENVRP